ncbi:MAG: hypothetical protein C7B46_08125 [Sulfobacillus benefaciens]|uniref:Uncharacterized protein n=1 Tax=Sulfobacillus benefaciens TaxID=453960 RepID=A0A2T2XH14_9FIRM|nr:MAG: hypothetical protein C7B46_08125 [Sulfobacillus benefaciens]
MTRNKNCDATLQNVITFVKQQMIRYHQAHRRIHAARALVEHVDSIAKKRSARNDVAHRASH